jgi:hypothetical protein
MPVYVGTGFFGTANYGWSESYGMSQATPAEAVTNLTSILTLRLAMCFSDVSLIGAMVSDTAVKGDSYPTLISFPLPGTWVGTTGEQTAARGNCLRLLMLSAPTIRGNRYLHGIPETQFTKTFYAPTTPFVTAFGAYASALVSTFGTLTRIKGAVTPPFFTWTQYTGFEEQGQDFKKVGRPFNLPRGRRQVA